MSVIDETSQIYTSSEESNISLVSPLPKFDDSYVMIEYPLIQSKHMKNPDLEWTSEEIEIKDRWRLIQSKRDKLKKSVSSKKTKSVSAKIEGYSPDSISCFEEKHSEEKHSDWMILEIAQLISKKQKQTNRKKIQNIDSFIKILPSVLRNLSTFDKEKKVVDRKLYLSKVEMETEIKAIKDKYHKLEAPLRDEMDEIIRRKSDFQATFCDICPHKLMYDSCYYCDAPLNRRTDYMNN